MVEKYEFTENMGQISGFGGGYEAVCRAMLKAGLDWFDANPDANPRFHGWEGVYGVIYEDNDDAKRLSDAVIKASGDDCTGAMHQAVISHIIWIRKNGWEKYKKEMSEKKGRR